MEKPTTPRTSSPRPHWMSDMSLRLIDVRADYLLRLDHNQNMEQTLTKAVRKYLDVDTRRIAEVSAEDIGACLEMPTCTPSGLQGAYLVLKPWYRHASGQQPHPSCIDLDKLLGYYAALYQWGDPPTPLAGPYQLTSPISTLLMKLQPREILRCQLYS